MSNGEWGDVINNCHGNFCPATTVQYHSLTLTLPDTPIGERAGISCAVGGIYVLCTDDSTWSSVVENTCTQCLPGQYPSMISENEISCNTCPAGRQCPDGTAESMSSCYGQFYSEPGAQVCSLCEDGYTIKSPSGNAECVHCAANEYVLNNQCVSKSICSSVMEDDYQWPETFVGYDSIIYVSTDSEIGFIKRPCNLVDGIPTFGPINYSGLGILFSPLAMP